MKFRNIYTLVLALLVAVPSMAEKVQGIEDNGRPSVSNKRLKAVCINASAQVDLDINNVRARIMNGGDMWWDLVGSAKYEIPKVSEDSNEPRRHSLFAGSIWIGGLNNGNIHTAAQTYRQGGGNDFWAGPIDTVAVTVDNEDCEYWDNIFQVTRDEIDLFIEEFERDGSVASVPDNIRNWPANGRSDQNEARFMAPYVNVGGGPGYDPASGDYPDIRGDKALWFVYNDLGNIKTETGSAEIGLEFRTMAFGFQTNDEINNMTFYQTTIFNRGKKQLDSTFFGQWVDADLGYAFDDYIGCDIDRGLGICYNGDNFDDGAFGYGSNPPSIGVDFFEGPLADIEIVFPGGTGDGVDNDGDGEVDEMDTTYYSYMRKLGYEEMPIVYEGDGVDNNRNDLIDEPDEDIGMSKFVYYNNDFTTTGNPVNRNRTHFYNYLTAKWKNGDCISFGGNGFTTATGGCTDFMFPDDPRDPNGWSEVTSNNPVGDRRFLQSAGPFTLKPGAVNEVTIGVVWARASSGGNTGSYDLLLLADDKAQGTFLNDFEILNGPEAPSVNNVELDREIVIMMDRDDYLEMEEGYAETEITSEGREVQYSFQGYQLFQLANSQVTAAQIQEGNVDLAKEVWQVDINDGITRLVNQEFDPEVAQNLPSLKVDGTDEGILHVIRLTDDAFASGNSRLINNKTYHFALIAYASADENNPDHDRQYLAGRKFTQFSVTPRQTDILFDGTKLQASYGDGPEITRIEGAGSGGMFLELTDETVAEILENGVDPTPTYKIGRGPVELKVINPLKVPLGEYTLRFFDVEVENTNGEELFANVSSLQQLVRTRRGDLQTEQGQAEAAKALKDAAEAELISKEERVEVIDSLLTKTELSEEDSIFYESSKVVLMREISALMKDTAELAEDYRTELSELNQATNLFNTATTNLANQIKRADTVLWELTRVAPDGVEESVMAARGLYVDDEFVIDEWGMSIHAGPEYFPLENEDDQTNGYLGSEVIYEDDAIEWLSALPQQENTSDQIALIYDWIRAGANFPNEGTADPAIHDVEYQGTEYDPIGIYKDVADAMIAPYVLTSRNTSLNNTFPTFGICQAPSYGLECENLRILPSIDLVFTSDREKWSRVIVAEMGENTELTEGNAAKFHLRKHQSMDLNPSATGEPTYSGGEGFSWFPGYAINVETGERLNIIIGENSSLPNPNARDMIWNPSSQLTNPNIPILNDGGPVVGGMHYIYVMNSTSNYRIGNGDYETAYDGCAQYEQYLNPESSQYSETRLRGVWSACAWAMPAMLADGFKLRSFKDGIVPTETAIRVRVNSPYRTYATSENPENGNMPLYRFNTDSIAPVISADLGADALKNVRIVPNPYYAQSAYEGTQIDNFAKLTNLPKNCEIKIYTVNGQLVRTYNKGETDDTHNTELLWDLKNNAGVPISSGVYIINVQATLDDGSGPVQASTTVKFFAIMKPIDLDTF